MSFGDPGPAFSAFEGPEDREREKQDREIHKDVHEDRSGVRAHLHLPLYYFDVLSHHHLLMGIYGNEQS